MTLPALSDKESLAGSSVALLACPQQDRTALERGYHHQR